MPRGGGTLAIDPVSQLQGRHAPCARNAALRVSSNAWMACGEAPMAKSDPPASRVSYNPANPRHNVWLCRH